MATLETLKKLAGKVGNLREMVHLLGTLWRENASGFEKLLAESAPAWKDYECISLALRILSTEHDDAKLRPIICSATDSARIDPSERESLYLVAALWGDAWAKEVLAHALAGSIRKAIRSDVGDTLWSLRRCAMVGQWGDRDDLDRLSRRLKENGTDPECAGMLEALFERDQKGFDGLTQRLEHCLTRKKISDADVAACFLLGTTGDSRYAPLFLRLWRELRGSDFWTGNLRLRALSSFAYATLLGAPVQEVIEEWLVHQQKKLLSRWFGGSPRPDFLLICDLLWNVRAPIRRGTLDVLQAVAVGSHKRNSGEAIALLLLKGIDIPANATLDREALEVKSAEDMLQHDKILNFSYYWRCKKMVTH